MRFLLSRFTNYACRSCSDIWQHSGLPGYSQLAWSDRSSLNVRALLMLFASREFYRMLAWLLVWQLGAQILVWHNDWHGPAAATPLALALVWLMPWFAARRRRLIATLLGNRW